MLSALSAVVIRATGAAITPVIIGLAMLSGLVGAAFLLAAAHWRLIPPEHEPSDRRLSRLGRAGKRRFRGASALILCLSLMAAALLTLASPGRLAAVPVVAALLVPGFLAAPGLWTGRRSANWFLEAAVPDALMLDRLAAAPEALRFAAGWRAGARLAERRRTVILDPEGPADLRALVLAQYDPAAVMIRTEALKKPLAGEVRLRAQAWHCLALTSLCAAILALAAALAIPRETLRLRFPSSVLPPLFQNAAEDPPATGDPEPEDPADDGDQDPQSSGDSSADNSGSDPAGTENGGSGESSEGADGHGGSAPGAGSPQGGARDGAGDQESPGGQPDPSQGDGPGAAPSGGEAAPGGQGAGEDGSGSGTDPGDAGGSEGNTGGAGAPAQSSGEGAASDPGQGQTGGAGGASSGDDRPDPSGASAKPGSGPEPAAAPDDAAGGAAPGSGAGSGSGQAGAEAGDKGQISPEAGGQTGESPAPSGQEPAGGAADAADGGQTGASGGPGTAAPDAAPGGACPGEEAAARASGASSGAADASGGAHEDGASATAAGAAAGVLTQDAAEGASATALITDPALTAASGATHGAAAVTLTDPSADPTGEGQRLPEPAALPDGQTAPEILAGTAAQLFAGEGALPDAVTRSLTEQRDETVLPGAPRAPQQLLPAWIKELVN